MPESYDLFELIPQYHYEMLFSWSIQFEIEGSHGF